MRKWFASLAILGLAATAATAQTIPNAISNSLFQVSEDDNGPELAYKLYYPSSATEAFNVDFNSDGAGMTVMGVAVELYVSFGNAQIETVAICSDNLALDASGRTPDLASPLSSLTNPTGGPGVSGSFCTSFTTYDTPDVTLGTGGTHAVVKFATNDSNTWMCTDAWDSSGFNHTGARHSFWTSDLYATPASYSFNKWNYMIRLAGPPATPGGGLFLVNGTTSGTMQGGGTIALQFWSSDGAAPTLYLQVLNIGPLIPLPGIVLSTGNTNFVPNGIQQLGVLSGTMPCSGTGFTFTFGCFFSDNLDKKKNGKNKIKLSNFASTTVNPSKICSPNVCFGIKDDGAMDSGIFNPRIWYGFGSSAKTNDCASVHMGLASPLAPVVTNLTSVESATWDFCGTNPCWQQVGIYQSNLTVDPLGNTPNLGSPLTSIGGSSACYPGGAYTGAWGFPATVYDTPDILANTTTDYHTSFEWASNDSCLYVGLDNNGTSDDGGDDCAPATSGGPANSSSFYSLDGFATPAVDLSGGGVYPVCNLLERINWN